MIEGNSLEFNGEYDPLRTFNFDLLEKLNSLAIRRFQLSPETLTSISKLTSLRHLDLSECGNIQKEDFVKLYSLSQLETLNVTKVKIINSAGHLFSISPGTLRELRLCLPKTKIIHSNFYATNLEDLKDHRHFQHIFDKKGNSNALFDQKKTIDFKNQIKNLWEENERFYLLDAFGDSIISMAYDRSRSGWYPYDHNVLIPYINMSLIRCLDTRNRFAAQAPVKSKYADTHWDFWNAVLKQKANVIVALTELEVPYYPEKVGTLKLLKNNQEIYVHLSDLELIQGKLTLMRRTFSVQNLQTRDSLKVVQLHTNEWVDGRALSVDQMWQLIQLIVETEKQQPGNSIYHCMAGIGRTGTLFACLIIYQALVQATSNLNSLSLNFYNLIYGLRQQRPGMIQTLEQAESIVEFFLNHPKFLKIPIVKRGENSKKG